MAALGSAVVASACCWLPLLLVGLGLSLSLGGLIGTIEVLRPYLLTVAGLCLAAGFYLIYFRTRPRRRLPQVALWTALVATLTMALFPYYSGALFGAGNVNGSGPTGAENVITAGANNPNAITLTYKVDGMTCGGCEAAVCSAMSEVPSVERCRASYEEGRAWATVSKERFERESMVQAIQATGFTATRLDE